MIIIRLKGGMGNQMFQYAFGLQLAQLLQTEMRLDLSSLLDRSKGDFVYRNFDLSIFHVEESFVHSPTMLKLVYQLKSSLITKIIRQQIDKGKHYVKEEHFHFDASLINNALNNTVYEGWFQSPRYFEGVKDLLRQKFTFKNPLLPQSASLAQQIRSCNAVCLNVRRTDFLQVDNLNTTDQSYFLRTAQRMAEEVSNPVFFVFSDDIEWCRDNIHLEHPLHIVDHQHKGEKFGNYLQLMSICQHFIIPNSSFAWWATWLCQNPGKIVIAPQKWFNDPNLDTSDLVPEEWIRL